MRLLLKPSTLRELPRQSCRCAALSSLLAFVACPLLRFPCRSSELRLSKNHTPFLGPCPDALSALPRPGVSSVSDVLLRGFCNFACFAQPIRVAIRVSGIHRASRRSVDLRSSVSMVHAFPARSVNPPLDRCRSSWICCIRGDRGSFSSATPFGRRFRFWVRFRRTGSLRGFRPWFASVCSYSPV